MPTTGLANGSDIQQILDLDDHLLKQFAMLIQFLRWSHLRARRRLLAADGSERVAKLLRSEDALAGLLQRQRLLLARMAHVGLANALLLGRDLLKRRLKTSSSAANGAKRCPACSCILTSRPALTRRTMTQM